jgi:hypothetical protein
MTTKVALYCRVSASTKDQTTENQLRELTAYCDRMGYEVSGAKTHEKRPAYNQMCKDAFLKRFYTVPPPMSWSAPIVWKWRVRDGDNATQTGRNSEKVAAG